MALAVFIIAGLLSAVIVWKLESARVHEMRALATSLATERASAVQSNMDRAFSAAYAIGAMVRQGHGAVPEFSATAEQMLPFYPGVGSFQLAPNGVVSEIVPLAGNEKAIGHNLLADPSRNKEAFLARDTGQLTLAGPFNLVQGGLGAVARLPVFLPSATGQARFWGFTVVLIRFPKAIESAQLDQLSEHGFHYALWRTHPDTNKRQVISASADQSLLDPVERVLSVPNATWTLSISPIHGWGDPQGLLLKTLLALAFSLLLGGLAKLQMDGKNQERLLEMRVALRTQDLQRFAEVTAHHLQEPARRMANYADRLTSQLKGRIDDEDTRLSLDFIGQQARRMKALLSDVERYLAADQPRGPLAVTDPQPLAEQLIAHNQSRLALLQASVTLGALPAAWIDAPRLRDLFELALDNALQFANPEITDKAFGITVEGQPIGNKVLFSVSDNGPGIEPQYRTRVFRVFERLNADTEGTGIGLAIIARIAESCGGRAWIDEAAGGGCRLCIELPAQETA